MAMRQPVTIQMIVHGSGMATKKMQTEMIIIPNMDPPFILGNDPVLKPESHIPRREVHLANG
jgi:hypothetical protein